MEIPPLLPQGTTVTVKVPVCPCTGKSHIIVKAKIIKVLFANNQTWYVLDNSRSVNHATVIEYE